MSAYSNLVLSDGPSMYWKLDEAAGTVVTDSSGNGNHGKHHTGQVVGTGQLTLGIPGGTWGPDRALSINSYALDYPTTTGLAPGTGVKADSYNPFSPGAKITLECWCYKIDPFSFATMFSSSGDSGPAPKAPHPTLEWGQVADFFADPGVVVPQQMARWYARVNTFPVEFIDWGTINTANPLNEFKPLRWEHVAMTWDDTTGTAELWINGRSQGAQNSGAFTFDPPHFDTVTPTDGEIQIGWRGGPGIYPNPGNGEVWGGYFQHVAVYPRVLTGDQIGSHYRAGTRSTVYRKLIGGNDRAAAIERSLSRYFTKDVT